MENCLNNESLVLKEKLTRININQKFPKEEKSTDR